MYTYIFEMYTEGNEKCEYINKYKYIARPHCTIQSNVNSTKTFLNECVLYMRHGKSDKNMIPRNLKRKIVILLWTFGLFRKWKKLFRGNNLKSIISFLFFWKWCHNWCNWQAIQCDDSAISCSFNFKWIIF